VPRGRRDGARLVIWRGCARRSHRRTWPSTEVVHARRRLHRPGFRLSRRDRPLRRRLRPPLRRTP
jgi:hypothetical protein